MYRIIIYFLTLIVFSTSCNKVKEPVEIITSAISAIDTIETIIYKQTLVRTNPRNPEEIIQRERMFYYKKLNSDSLIGAKAHIYYFDNGFILYEDIYNGETLIRKNNRDSTALRYDLIKYPDFLKQFFWGKNTPYTMQAMLKFIVEHQSDYNLSFLCDTIINDRECYTIKVILTDKTIRPGMNLEFTQDSGSVSTSYLYFSRLDYYPQKMYMEYVNNNNPDRLFFTDHNFYDIKFNPLISDTLFNTSDKILKRYDVEEMKP
jgi:hypothetical protein